jgi:glutamate N-acetyltransferase/amino-acid N-acetyltransferase
VVPASTGVIGVKLPEEPIERASSALVDGLSPRNASDFAEAILTTDRGPKLVSAQLTVGRTKCRMLGIAKGAGMIHPNMATTLAFVATDAQIRPAALRRILARATEATFNRASVDGDTSTNDSIYALASGQASNACIEAKGSAADRFEAALTEVLESLAKMIVADGEGAEHLVRVRVSGARTDADAVQIARTIATSQLVKTAIHGCDPNWGRILAAAGRSGVRFKPGQVSVQIDRVPIFRDGEPIMTARTEARASRAMLRAEYDVEVRVGAGKGSGHYWTCDLGHEYVRINADYRS